MKAIPVEFLKKIGACESGVVAFEKEYGPNSIALDKVIRRCIKDGTKENLQYANWLIVRCMTKRQKVQYAIYAAEQVFPIWKKKRPDNDAPRKAIEAAKAYLKNPCKKTKTAAASAAAAVNVAAAYAYAASIYAAYPTAAYAAYAAANAAYAAANAYTHAAMRTKILRYGLTLIK